MRAKNTWVISDTHFTHENVCIKFKRYDGSPLRPFASAKEMDEFMVDAWNAKVKPFDRVYHLGDVTMHKKNLHILNRLNGKKVLVKGNHDIFELNDYLPYFEDIRGYIVKNGFIFSHIPLHVSQLERFKCNIHGHLHDKHLMNGNVIDTRYKNVCVEHTNYAPMNIDEVYAM